TFFFNDTPPTEIYTLSLHDALPIYVTDALVTEAHAQQRGARAEALDDLVAHTRVLGSSRPGRDQDGVGLERGHVVAGHRVVAVQIGEHTSELQSLAYLVCRLLLEKK